MAITNSKPLTLTTFITLYILLSSLTTITTSSRTSIKEEPKTASKPNEIPDPDLPLLPQLPNPNDNTTNNSLPQQHPKLQLPPVPYIPPLSNPSFRGYLPKMPSMPRLPSLPRLPSFPRLPRFPSPNVFSPFPGLQRASKPVSAP